MNSEKQTSLSDTAEDKPSTVEEYRKIDKRLDSPFLALRVRMGSVAANREVARLTQEQTMLSFDPDVYQEIATRGDSRKRAVDAYMKRLNQR